MDQILICFINALRSQGIRIGTSESLDAIQAVHLIGYQYRLQLKQALCCTLIKSQEDQSRFEQTFERFFHFEQPVVSSSKHNLPPEPNPAQPQSTVPISSDTENQQPSSPLGQLLMQGDGNVMATAMANAAQTAQTSQIRVITQKGQFVRRMLNALGQDKLDEEIWSAEKSSHPSQQALAHTLREAREILRQQIRSHVERQYLLYAEGEGKTIRESVMMDTPLENLSDQKDIQALIRKLAKRLVATHSRRRKVHQRGKLDVRATIRHNIPYGGVLLETHWKTKRIDRPKIITICDVSGSVRQSSRFLLTFLFYLTDILSKIRAFAFSYDLAEVTDLFQHHSIDQAISTTLHELGRGSTNYGRSLHTFSNLCLNDIDHHSTVIIMGDARNNYGDARLELIQAIHGRCKHLFWLNPEHSRSWGQGDSEMLRYRTYCHRVQHCSTLSQLERFISNILRYAQ